MAANKRHATRHATCGWRARAAAAPTQQRSHVVLHAHAPQLSQHKNTPVPRAMMPVCVCCTLTVLGTACLPSVRVEAIGGLSALKMRDRGGQKR